jgi:Helicase associated domain
LFADPFSRPSELGNGEYQVNDPGFDPRPLWQIVPDYTWMRERVLAIRLAMLGQSTRRLIPAAEYLDVLSSGSIDFARAFDVRLIEQTTTSWEFWFGLLEQFVERNRHARVPVSYKVKSHQLGAWVNRQRTSRSKGTLDADRERRLENLPGWTWDPHADLWEEGFTHLLDYVEQNGHARILQTSTIDDYRLGSWVNTQRRFHSEGTLDADRERRLENLPGWMWDAVADLWEEGFTHLLDYVEQNGNARVSRSCNVDDYPLGMWVMQQRKKRAKGTFDADRERRLENLPGWTWDPRADRWEEGFTRLLQYVKHNHHARVPVSYKVESYRLGSWVAKQRAKYAKGTLDADRQHRLQDPPGWTWRASSSN